MRTIEEVLKEMKFLEDVTKELQDLLERHLAKWKEEKGELSKHTKNLLVDIALPLRQAWKIGSGMPEHVKECEECAKILTGEAKQENGVGDADPTLH